MPEEIDIGFDQYPEEDVVDQMPVAQEQEGSFLDMEEPMPIEEELV